MTEIERRLADIERLVAEVERAPADRHPDPRSLSESEAVEAFRRANKPCADDWRPRRLSPAEEAEARAMWRQWNGR